MRSGTKSSPGQIIQRHPLTDRGDDLYETPACAVEALLRTERLPHRLWEPACGRGSILKVLGMLGSPRVGERAAAGLKADELVKQLGLRWPDIIAVERAPTTVAADGGEISWRAMLRVCHDCSDELSVKERGLIDTLSRWRGAPTPKQIKWLTDIYERLWGRPD